MNQLAKAFLFFDFKQKSRPTRTDFFHITSVFISTTGNNCRQSVVSGSKGTNTHSDIFSPFSESASKESYNHAVL